MIVLDTNILIEVLKANKKTIEKVQSFTDELVISSITVMELYYGALNKAELKEEAKIFTYNRKDFQYIDGLTLIE